MHFDMHELDGRQRYKIIASCITPRPIAWISSQSLAGVRNVAPFSFFNTLGHAPPTIAVGIVAHAENRLKDTAANINQTGEFVVNLVGEHDAKSMNLTSSEVGPEIDEGAMAKLEFTASVGVNPERIASAPASFECRTTHFIETGPNQVAVIAQVVHAHIRDEFILDPARLLINVPAMHLISRLHGAGWFGRQTDQFEILRP